MKQAGRLLENRPHLKVSLQAITEQVGVLRLPEQPIQRGGGIPALLAAWPPHVHAMSSLSLSEMRGEMSPPEMLVVLPCAAGAALRDDAEHAADGRLRAVHPGGLSEHPLQLAPCRLRMVQDQIAQETQIAEGPGWLPC